MAEMLEFLMARLHGRYGRQSDRGRLPALGRSASVAELARALVPGPAELTTAVALQRRLEVDLATELRGFLPFLPEAGRRWIEWSLVRLELEDLKLFLRARAGSGTSPGDEAGRADRRRTAPETRGDLDPAVAIASWAARWGSGPLAASMRRIQGQGRGEDRLPPFFLEAALEHDWLRHLLDLTGGLPPGDRELLTPLAQAEADGFHLQLVTRGRGLYRLDPVRLLALHLSGTRVSRSGFRSMLADTDLRVLAERILGRVIDTLPVAATGEGEEAWAEGVIRLEGLAGDRLRRLARRAFRRSHLGLAAVAGYAVLRRFDIADLTRVSETIRLRAVKAHGMGGGREDAPFPGEGIHG